MPSNTWVRAFFSEFPKCDILLNNNCDVFNNYILDARELPILSMFEMIKTQLMTRHYNKQKELANQMEGTFCPKIRKKLSKNAEWANMCFAIPSGQGVFQVKVRDYSHIVDINSKTCDCRRWQLTRVPCSHAIACLRHERIKPESVLPACYSVQTFNTAYGFNIWPCRDQRQWEKVDGPQVQPPLYEKKVGRPPKSRKKQPHEVQGKNGPKFSKHGVTVHSVQRLIIIVLDASSRKWDLLLQKPKHWLQIHRRNCKQRLNKQHNRLLKMLLRFQYQMNLMILSTKPYTKKYQVDLKHGPIQPCSVKCYHRYVCCNH